MLKQYLKSIGKYEELIHSSLVGLHMATTDTDLYKIHSFYFCAIRETWFKDINGESK